MAIIKMLKLKSFDLKSCLLVKQSTSGTVIQSNCQTVEQSNCRTVKQSNCRTVEQSNSRTVEQSSSQTVFFLPFPEKSVFPPW